MTTPADPHFPQVPPPPAAAWRPELGGQLHPAAIAVWSLGQAGAVIILFIVNPASVLFAAPFVLLLVAANAVRYSRFRWRYADGTLVIEQGLLNRQRRVIPVERVQSVDLVRRLTHRLFGVTAVQVEAIGSGDTEGQLDALSLEVAGRLRETLLAGRAAAGSGAAVPAGGGEAESPGDERLVRVPNRRLLTAGATEANATLLAAAAGGLWQLFGDRFDELVGRLPGLLGGNTLLVFVLVAVVVGIGLLVGAQVLLYWNFELRHVGTALQVRRGLLEQRFDTVPLRRLQALRVEENLPRRLLGLAAVRADVAGKPGGGSGGTDTLLPIGSAAEARALVARVLDDARATDPPLEPMPGRARTRRLFRALAFTAVVTVAAAVAWGAAGLLAALVAVPAIGIAESSYRALGHAEMPGLVVTRAGWWVRRTAFVPEERLQTLAVTATVLQRWRRLATLELQIARSPGLWSGPQMIDLDRGVARRLVLGFAPRMATGQAEPVAPRREAVAHAHPRTAAT